MTRIVVDASIAIAWFVDEAGSAAANAKLAQWRRDSVQPIAPSWFLCEFANNLHQRMRAGHLRWSFVELSMPEIFRFVAIEETPGVIVHQRGLEIASQLALPASYDA